MLDTLYKQWNKSLHLVIVLPISGYNQFIIDEFLSTFLQQIYVWILLVME